MSVFSRCSRPDRDFNNLLTAITRGGLDLEHPSGASITIDLADADRPFPNTVVPVIALVSGLRARGAVVHVHLPKAERVHQLFVRKNWAHHLDPDRFNASTSYKDRHLALYSFSDSDELHVIVDAIISDVLGSMQISQSAIDALNWVLWEVAENVVRHAECDRGFLQVEALRERIAVVVADSGIGIRRSLLSYRKDLRSDSEAIECAIRRGVTRNPEIGQGNGLSGSLAIATALDGQMTIRSHCGSFFQRAAYPVRVSDDSPRYPGTVLDLQLRHDLDIELGPTITGLETTRYRPQDVVDELYSAESPGVFVMEIRNETGGFGTRDAGAAICTRVLNILSRPETKCVVLDWEGLQIISSSFADEFVGKLFRKIGPMDFMRRVNMINGTNTVTDLLDSAITRRMRSG